MLKLARTHHYLFAHKLLPMLFFKEPEMFMSGLKNDCNSILSNWWEKIGFTLEGHEKIALNGFRFRITAKKYKYYTAYFVKMPEAKYAPEAIIVAFVIIKIQIKMKSNSSITPLMSRWSQGLQIRYQARVSTAAMQVIWGVSRKLKNSRKCCM